MLPSAICHDWNSFFIFDWYLNWGVVLGARVHIYSTSLDKENRISKHIENVIFVI